MDFEFDSRLDTKGLSESGVRLELVDARGDALISKGARVALTVLGPDSAAYRAALDAAARRRTEAALAAKKAGTELVLDQELEAVELLAATVIAWENVNTSAGDAIPCTPETVRAFLRYPVIREQVDRFAGSRANFLQASSSN